MDKKKILLAKLEDAKNKVDRLKGLLEANTTNTDKSKSLGRAVAPVFSKEQFFYTRYMTLSTVKLFENRGAEVFRIEDSVGLYFIVPNQPVRTAARSAHCRIVRMQEEYQDGFHPPAFVQVGDWVYPLMAGSMVYKSEHNYYLFPDLLSSVPGSSVGVILPVSSNKEREIFEKLLLHFSQLDEFPSRPPASFGKSTDMILGTRTSVHLIRTESGLYTERNNETSQHYSQQQYATGGNYSDQEGHGYGRRIGAGIQAGGELFSRGLEYGATGTAQFICMGASCLKSSLQREEHDTDIPCIVTDGVVCAKELTERVVNISSSIMEKLGAITSNFAALTACYIKASATPYVLKLVEASGISQNVIDEVEREVGDLAVGIAGASCEAHRGLQNAAGILANAVGSETTEVVTHCYGPSAARVLQSAGEVVVNVAVAGANAHQMTDVKGNARATIRKTGLAICTEACDR